MEICEKFEEIVIFYIENRIVGKERQKINSHIKECERCKNYLEYVKNLCSNKNMNLDEEYWNHLTKKIILKINDALKKSQIRKLKTKKILIGFLCTICFLLIALTKYHRNLEVITYFHFYRDLPVIEKLDELQEIASFMEESNE